MTPLYESREPSTRIISHRETLVVRDTDYMFQVASEVLRRAPGSSSDMFSPEGSGNWGDVAVTLLSRERTIASFVSHRDEAPLEYSLDADGRMQFASILSGNHPHVGR